MIDLHMHSNISDGSFTVDELIQLALEKNLKMISITDHDTYYDWSYKSTYDLTILGGMEISAYDFEVSKKVHLLLYGNQLQLTHVNPIIKDTLKKRHANSKRQLEAIIKAGYDIHYDELKKSKEGILYKQHIMEGLKNKNYTTSLNGSLYKKLFKDFGVATGDIEYPNALDVIKAANKDGILVVLAHPGLSEVFDRVPIYVQAGLKGIETYHGLSNLHEQAISRELAQKYHLIETIGSDFHGHYGIEPEIGNVKTNEDFQKKLYAYCLKNIVYYDEL